jgi:hypothetical protein
MKAEEFKQITEEARKEKITAATEDILKRIRGKAKEGYDNITITVDKELNITSSISEIFNKFGFDVVTTFGGNVTNITISWGK